MKILTLMLFIFSLAACGGEGGNAVRFDPQYPSKLLGFKSQLGARAYFISAENDAQLSPAVSGVLENDEWLFQLGDDLGDKNRVRIEFTANKELFGSGELILGSVVALIENGVANSESPESFNLTKDDDLDGLPNIDEILLSVDPSVSDTDGDGVLDGNDIFPSVSGEWSDADCDGIGDRSDPDIDGDKLLNDDEKLKGTDPFLPDTDGDGFLDSEDICPVISDISQVDSDADGVGDACDEDRDGDGLVNVDEVKAGSDPQKQDTDGDGLGDGYEVAHGTSPVSVDTDEDEIKDAEDNCPLNKNRNQSDVDADGKGDACDEDADGDSILNAQDNCLLFVNPRQEDADLDGIGDECDDDADNDGVKNELDVCAYNSNAKIATEDKDSDGVDSKCDLDDLDPLVGDHKNKIFVSSEFGSDENNGTKQKPLKSLAKALAAGKVNAMPVYVSGGVYSAREIVLDAGVVLFGGFKSSTDVDESFSSRDVRSDDPAFKSVIIRDDVTTTLYISSSTTISGFHIQNEASVFSSFIPQSTLVISGGDVRIERNSIFGNVVSTDANAVRVLGGNVTLDKNFIDGGGFDSFTSESKGLNSESGKIVATNNIIVGGFSRFVTGAELASPDLVFVNNTVNATSANETQGFARGIVLSSPSFTIANNIIYTNTADDELPLLCKGENPSAGSKFNSNVLANFSSDAFRPVAFNCDGGIATDENFKLGEAEVGANKVFDGMSLADLHDINYLPIASMLIDSGLDTSSQDYGGVATDHAGRQRPVGVGFDVGALEK